MKQLSQESVKDIAAGFAIGLLIVIGVLAPLDYGLATGGGSGACKLEISKTVDKVSAVQNDTLVYAITFKNTGTANCTGGGVHVKDTLDTLLTYVSETHSSNVTAGYGSSPVFDAGTRTVHWNADTLTPGESGSATITVKINTPTCACDQSVSVSNTAKITSYEYQNFTTWVVSNAVQTVVTKNCSTPPATPPTADIKANGSDGPIKIGYAEVAALSWTSTNATSCTVSPGGFTGTSGTHPSLPATEDRTYVLVCTGPGGTATDSVFVEDNPAPAVVDIKANGSDGPITVAANENFTLSWTSENASACTVTPGNYTGISGSRTTSIAASQVYTVICTGLGGTDIDSVAVNVSQANAPTADIKANGSDAPITITSNTSATLTWTSTNATSCIVTPGSFTGTTGSRSTGNLTADQTYTVTCTGAGGTAADSVTVRVNAPVVTADIKANGSDGPLNVDYNGSVVLTWSSSGATSCTVVPGSYSGLTGSRSIENITANRTYVLTCVNGGQSATDSVTLTVGSQSAPTVTISANPSNIQKGNSSVLIWSSQNATTCTGAGAWSGSKSLSGSQSVSPTDDKTYMIICSNASGQTASAEATVYVSGASSETPSVTLTASPSGINAGQSSVLNWYTQNVTTCYASNGWTGGRGSSGAETVYPTQTTTYYLSCYGLKGQQVAAQATVTVNFSGTPTGGTNQPSVFLTVNPGVIEKGGSSVLTWYSANASYCTASGGWAGVKQVNGSETVYPTETKSFTITCTNSYGTAVDTKTVTVTTGQVLGVGDVVTGPEDTLPLVLVFGFLGALALHFFVFRRQAGPTANEAAPRRTIAPLHKANGVSATAPVRAGLSSSALRDIPRTLNDKDHLENLLTELRTRELRPDTE